MTDRSVLQWLPQASGRFVLAGEVNQALIGIKSDDAAKA
jgi:hypothetical protein